MKIKLNQSDRDKFIKLIETKELNISIADLLNKLCFSMDSFPELKDDLKTNNNELVKKINETIFDYFELNDEDESNIEIRNRYFTNCFSYVDLSQYDNNDFKKYVNIKETVQNSYKLHYLSYPKYSFFPFDDIEVDESNYYQEQTKIGISDQEYSFLTLSKNNNIWMCITPNEINTMKKHIDNAKGDVITFGLGLGYFAYMASNKNDVKSVTIVDNDDNVINLFKEKLLPLFKNKDKLHFIKNDALNYLKNNDLSKYDYAFFDLWHDAEDGLPLYLEINKQTLNTKCGFWIDESLICMYRRCLLTVMEETLYNYQDDDYRKASNPIDKIINEIYFKTKSITFTSYSDLHHYLSRENILILIKKN